MSGVELLAIGLLALLFVYIGLVLWGMGTLTAEEAERHRRRRPDLSEGELSRGSHPPRRAVKLSIL